MHDTEATTPFQITLPQSFGIACVENANLKISIHLNHKNTNVIKREFMLYYLSFSLLSFIDLVTKSMIMGLIWF